MELLDETNIRTNIGDLGLVTWIQLILSWINPGLSVCQVKK